MKPISYVVLFLICLVVFGLPLLGWMALFLAFVLGICVDVAVPLAFILVVVILLVAAANSQGGS